MPNIARYSRNSLLAAVGVAVLGASFQSVAQDSGYEQAQKVLSGIKAAMGNDNLPPSSSAPKKAPAGVAAAKTAASAHLDAPRRKAGWWEITSKRPTGQIMASQQMCIGAASEAVYSAFDQIVDVSSEGGKCAKHEFVKKGTTWAFDLQCESALPASMGGGMTYSKGTIAGDITTNYVVNLSMTASGTTTTGSIFFSWKGQCPVGRKEGDQVVDNNVYNVIR